MWKTARGRISYQVLQEFYAKVVQKSPSAREIARAEARDLLAWQPVAIDGVLIETAWSLQDRFPLSFWDALIVAAAKKSGCQYLLTEDLKANQAMDEVTVVNPFLASPGDLAPV